METQHNQQQQHGTSSHEGGQGHARGDYPTGFGRGWIPAGRDIGLPGEFPRFAAAAPGADEPAESYWAPIYGQPGADGQPGVDPDDRDFAVPVSVYHFGPPRRAAFLHHLAEDGNVRRACAAIGVSAQAAYLARRRDVVFRAGWAAALVVAREQVAQVLATRAIEGYRDPIYYRGAQIGERVRFDTRLLLAHLARLDTRADDAVAEAHAERFDEILALVAGEAFPAEMEDLPDGRHYEADPLLPIARDRFVEHAAADAVAHARWGPGGTEHQEFDDPDDEPEEPTPLELAESAARETATAVQDDWDGRVAAVNDALAVGALPRVLAVVWPTGVGAEIGAGEFGDARGRAGSSDCPDDANTPCPISPPVAPAEAGAYPAPPEQTGLALGADPSELTRGADAANDREAGWAPACAGATATGEGGEIAAIVEPVSKVTPRPEFSPRTVSTVSTSRKAAAAKRKREAATLALTDTAPRAADVEPPAPAHRPRRVGVVDMGW